MKAAFLAAALMACAPCAALAADYSGTWEVAVREAGHKNYYLPMIDGRLVIEAGNAAARYNRLAFTGSEQGDGLHLACRAAGKSCGSLVLRLAGDRLAGTGTLVDADGLDRPVTLAGAHPLPRRAPRTIDYDPTDFHNFYSPDIPAVLHLQPGDTLRTRSLDSRGYDRDGRPRAPRGNPLTGPFFIDGAMPGDTLVVHLERVRTNRDSAYQANLVASSALETGYAGAIAAQGGGFTRWRLDAAAGTATLLDAGARMTGYSVRLDPMLGCVGVAPPRDEVLASGISAPSAATWIRRQCAKATRSICRCSSPARCCRWATAMPARAMASCRARDWRPRWTSRSASNSFPARLWASPGWRARTR